MQGRTVSRCQYHHLPTTNIAASTLGHLRITVRLTSSRYHGRQHLMSKETCLTVLKTLWRCFSQAVTEVLESSALVMQVPHLKCILKMVTLRLSLEQMATQMEDNSLFTTNSGQRHQATLVTPHQVQVAIIRIAVVRLARSPHLDGQGDIKDPAVPACTKGILDTMLKAPELYLWTST